MSPTKASILFILIRRLIRTPNRNPKPYIAEAKIVSTPIGRGYNTFRNNLPP